MPTQTKFTCYVRSYAIYCDDIALPNTSASVIAHRADGKVYSYSKSGSEWRGDPDINDRLNAIYAADGTTVDQWIYTTANHAVESYDGKGLLLSETNIEGERLTFTYSMGTTNDTQVARYPADAPGCSHHQDGALLPSGTLACVTDRAGRQLQFEYDAKLRISRVIDPAGLPYIYSYDGQSGGCIPGTTTYGYGLACNANNLTSVTYPDGKSRTYYYNENARINDGTSCPGAPQQGNGFGHLISYLTGITDENGQRYASWSYDCYGKASISEHAGGVDKIRIDFGAADADGSRTNTVTTYGGTAATPLTVVRSYHSKSILGVGRNDSIDQLCAGCDGMKARTYDAKGNVATSTDFGGRVNIFTYDLTRNLETRRVEASGTGSARTVNTEWHPALRVPIRIAEPKRITTYTYDEHRNLLSKSIQPTSDISGASGFSASSVGSTRNWTYSYNEFGQVLTVKGPRTDVNDSVSYAYDSSGNLVTVVNALGHVTTLSDYDVNGRAGKITDPNGLETVLNYTLRGWLASASVGGQLTSYDYDGVGQLRKATAPDGSWVSYTYDAAHRLIAIGDNGGNVISYTLDNLGNRAAEQVRDPGGNLVRQVSRVYNSLNQLKQITGGL